MTLNGDLILTRDLKRDFLESASNSANFVFSSVYGSLYHLAMGALLAWDCQCYDHKPELNVV